MVRKRASVVVAALLGTAVIAPGSPVAAQVPGPIDCPTIRDVDDVASGDIGVGYTVDAGERSRARSRSRSSTSSRTRSRPACR